MKKRFMTMLLALTASIGMASAQQRLYGDAHQGYEM